MFRIRTETSGELKVFFVCLQLDQPKDEAI